MIMTESWHYDHGEEKEDEKEFHVETTQDCTAGQGWQSTVMTLLSHQPTATNGQANKGCLKGA